MHLQRENLFDNNEDICSQQFNVIYGEAGTGKSAYVRDYLDIIRQKKDVHVLAFKGVSFAKESLYDIFQTDAKTILNSPVLRGHLVVWIDGAEKLMENEQLEAFHELVRFASEMPNLTVVLTIRKYSVQSFKLHILDILGRTNFVEIPPLSINEQKQLCTDFPKLQVLLNNPRLSQLLRIPFYLNFAVQIMDTIQVDTLTESTFKQQLWKYSIGKSDNRREQILEEIALKRAQSLSLYVNLSSSNNTIVQNLEQENLIEREGDDINDRFAIQHDIIEDWTLTRYIQKHWRNNPDNIFEIIGSEYAIRRAFRLWLTERLVEHDDNFNQFIQRNLINPSVAAYWKDTIMLAVLQSEHGADFLSEQRDFLLADDAKMLNRFIHIFKTACKEPDTESIEKLPIEDHWKIYTHNHKPTGEGWATLISFFYENIGHLSNYKLILQFIKDWSNKLRAFESVPPESREVGLILLHILEKAKIGVLYESFARNDYGHLVEDNIKILFQLAEVMGDEITLLIEEAIAYERDDANWEKSGFYKTVLKYALACFSGRELCMFLPDTIIKTAWSKWIKKPEKEKPFYHRDPIFDRESMFGLNNVHQLHYFPSIYYKTPTYFLLYFHPEKGLKFIVDLFNYATPQYVASVKRESAYGDRYTHVKSVEELTFTLPNGLEIKQISSPELYRMYRATVTSSDLLESVLMALEKWLFVLAESKKEENHETLRDAYDYLLLESKSVATTAVLVSVAIAHPLLVGDKIFPLLKIKAIYTLESDRQFSEMQAHSMLGINDEYPKWFQEERHKSNQLPHRKQELADLVLKLGQVESYQNQVFEILDTLGQNADSNDKNWRIRINNMDIRTFEVKGMTPDNQHAILGAKLENDLAEYVAEQEQSFAPKYDTGGHSHWAFEVFKNKNTEGISYNRWVEAYKICSEAFESGYYGMLLHNSPGAVAAIGLREFQENLTSEQSAWCIDIILNLADKVIESEKRDSMMSLSNNVHLYDRDPSVHSLPLLFREKISPEQRHKTTQLLLDALIHFQTGDNLKEPFFKIIGQTLWSIAPSIAKNLWYGLFAYAQFRAKNQLNLRIYNEHLSAKDKKKLDKELNDLMSNILKGAIEKPDFTTLTFKTHAHWWLDTAMMILSDDLQDGDFTTFIQKYMQLLVQETYKDRNGRHDNNWTNYMQADIHFQMRFASFLMSQPADIRHSLFDALLTHGLTRTNQHSHDTIKFVDDCLLWLILLSDDDAKKGKVFADLWEQLFETMKTHQKAYFLSKLFLNIDWYPSVPETTIYQPLDYQKTLYQKAIAEFGDKDIKSVVKLLGGIGSRVLLPDCLSLLVAIVKKAPTETWEIVEAERLIQHLFYNDLKTMRSRPQLFNDFIQLLDWLVDADSSLAFFFRERIVGTNNKNAN